MKKTIATVAALLALSVTAEARDIYVSTTGSMAGIGTQSMPYAKINTALKVAQPGDTIYVGSGVYSEKVTTVRSGTSDAPISIIGDGTAIIQTPKTYSGRVMSVYHDYHVIRGLTFTQGDILLYMFGVKGVVVDHNTFTDAKGECVRLRYQSTGNVISNNTIKGCGEVDFNLKKGRKNGEGIYVGTAPEQLFKNANEKVPDNAPLGKPLAVPDETHDNLIIQNTIEAPADCIEFKEAATQNTASDNVCSGGKDPEGAALASRGIANTFERNVISDYDGAGVRLGGDTDDQGIKNNVRNNIIVNVKGYVLKDVNKKQGEICGNTAQDYGDLSKSERDPTVACNANGSSVTHR